MSRTDNTQPLQLQWADTTRKGYVSHSHLEWGSGWDEGMLIVECDLTPHNNLLNFRSTKVKKRHRAGYLACRCQRVTYHHGGKNSEKGNYKQMRKLVKRSLRARQRQALYYTQAYGLRKDGMPNTEFDLLPEWGDHGAIKPFRKPNRNQPLKLRYKRLR